MSPTQFPDLNAVLAELAERAAAILGTDFVGAYPQGSFAVGDADRHSDCDFLIPVHRPVSGDQEAALRAMDDELPALCGSWISVVALATTTFQDLEGACGLRS
jgi:hypothetical protein